MSNIKNIQTKKRKKRMSDKQLDASKTFEVRDLRERGFFTVDDAFLDDNWLRLLKGAPSSVYFALCRHADKRQISFPSVIYLMEETGYGKRQIIRAISTLESHHMIEVDRIKGGHNMYGLLNRKHWRKVIVAKNKLDGIKGIRGVDGMYPMERGRRS